MLWSFVAALGVLIALGVILTTFVLQRQKREDFLVLQISQPLIESVTAMDESMQALLAASRAYNLTRETQFLQQYADAARKFDTSAARAYRLAAESRSQQRVVEYRKHFLEIRRLTDYQIGLVRDGLGQNANEAMLEAARIQRLAPDFSGIIIDEQRSSITREVAYITSLNQWLIIAMILGGVLILTGASMLTRRVEASLSESMRRSTRRTEAIVSGMSDGVLLLDGDGKSLFINPVGEDILGTSRVSVPLDEYQREYALFDVHARPLGRGEPVAQALSTGRPVNDVTIRIIREDRDIVVSTSAVPLLEEGHVTFVVVTFRDITDRILLEQQLQVQADTSQTLADAGAYFTSNIDPSWVVQAIAERLAGVLGDWAAVVLRSGDKDLRVAAIHHRDPEALANAKTYMFRQPLTTGEGIIGEAIANDSPSLISKPPQQTRTGEAAQHAADVASLLVLPLRARDEVLGALVIAAADPARAMTEEKLPLAELLAERASLAIDNANLYTEQVNARRKVEDLSRLKDEFLSIASHELRTPVTSIKGYTQLAKTLIKEDDLQTAEEYLGIALDQIDRMSRLILELLDVSRIETGRLEIRREPIQWGNFVRAIAERYDTMVGDRPIHVVVPDEQRIVVGDRDRLEQVLGNLIENAVKYSPDGADVVVSVEERPEQVVTAIADRGIGIPQDELSHVFERFHRGRQVSSTNYGGLGLGLYITRQIIERHGGTISVESRHGEGTTFQFTLPSQPATEPTATEA